MQSTAQDESNSQWCVEIVDTITNYRNIYYYEYFEHAEHYLISALREQETNIHLHGCNLEQHNKATQAKRNAYRKK